MCDWQITDERIKALSVDVCGQMSIGIDCRRCGDSAEGYSILLHEIGHCDSGAFYTPLEPLESRERCENRAVRRAVELSGITKKDIEQSHCSTIGELADYFDVSADFMRFVYCYLFHGNLSPDLYAI